MPEISRFYGIIINMYHEVGRHQHPHFHARYGEHKASFTIEPPVLLAGAMPRRQQNLILAWAELRHSELLKNWQLAEQEQLLQKIKGLE
jgi:hypothetical protein